MVPLNANGFLIEMAEIFSEECLVLSLPTGPPPGIYVCVLLIPKLKHG